MQAVQVVLLFGLFQTVCLPNKFISVTQSSLQVRSQINSLHVRDGNTVKPFRGILPIRSRFQNTLTQINRPLYHLHILAVCGIDTLVEQ